jgi:plastocyanin
MRLITRARIPLLSIAAFAVLGLVAAGCGGATSGGGGGASPSAASTPAMTMSPSAAAGANSASGTKVTISNFSFSPKKLTVKVGTTVTWTNMDSAPHNVTSTAGEGVNAKTTSLFASQTLNQGQSFSFTFTKKGDVYYECTIHASMASMHAEIEVE